MTKQAEIIAAGAIVFRHSPKQQVLVVHRPRYDDWSLPKGHQKLAEYLPATAVREVMEETGVRIQLGLRLPKIEYAVDHTRKKVHFFIGKAIKENPHIKDSEVDEVRWVNYDKVFKILSYPNELNLVHQAVELQDSHELLVVRHSKAMPRKKWIRNDQKRPLNKRGENQAEVLCNLFSAYGVSRLISSSSRRCMQTLQPYAHHHNMNIEQVDLLTEETAKESLADVAELMAKYLRQSAKQNIAVCGHRPVIPAMQQGIGLKHKTMKPGECLVIHTDNKQKIQHVDVYRPLF